MGNHEAAESLTSTEKAGFRLSKAPVTEGRAESSAPSFPLPDYEDLGALPVTCGQPVAYLVARDPGCLYAYWELPQPLPEEPLTLRIISASARKLLIETPLASGARDLFLPIPQSAAGGCYHAEVGIRTSDNGWQVLIRSNQTVVPTGEIAGEEHPDQFATLPFHLAFQKLVEMVPTESDPEPLLATLSRLQSEGRETAVDHHRPRHDEENALFATLLRCGLGETGGPTPEEIEALLRAGLSRSGSSGAWSGELMAVLAGEAWGSSVLQSHLERGGDLTSWLASWSSSAAGGSGWLASWPGRDQSHADRGYWSRHFSSWSSGVGGASGTSLGGSWSGRPLGEHSERSFFLHVNAEVIFYGGTHPDARVTINDEPVQLQPDGSFRHHFRFPDGVGSVPIVACSPDGVEERGVLLRFERGTARHGPSDATAQPEDLPDPLWQQPK